MSDLWIEAGKQARREALVILLGALFRWTIIATLVVRVYRESGPWTTTSIAILFVYVELTGFALLRLWKPK